MEHQVPPWMSSLDLRDCMEELLKFTLQSSVNQTLEFDLGLSKNFCSHLLLDDPEDPISLPSSSDSFHGVPPYPLYKRLASAMYQSVVSGGFFRTNRDMGFINEGSSLKQKETEWNQLIRDNGSHLLDILKTTDHEFNVPGPFFTHLKDGRKTVKVQCAVNEHNRIGPGALVLLNKCVLLEVQDIHKYDPFSKMLEAESLEKVLPGVGTVEEGIAFSSIFGIACIISNEGSIGNIIGLQIYREFHGGENKRSNGVVAICVSKVTAQPYIIIASILSGLGYGGVQSLLGISHTVGTLPEALPPPRSALLSSFKLPYKPNVVHCVMEPGHWQNMPIGVAIKIGVIVMEVIQIRIDLQWMSSMA